MIHSIALLDIAVIVIYLAGIVGIGAFFAKRGETAERYTVAGRSMPGWAVGFSLLGTYVSSISFLAYPGKSFAADWNPFVYSLSLPLAAWMAARFFVPLYRSYADVSAYSYLEKRFGPWARLYADICYLLTQLARIGSIMFLVALALNSLTGWDIRLIIVVTGVLVTLYTYLGGIEAVIWTDVVQSIVMMTGAVFCMCVIAARIPGGPERILAIASEHHKFSLGSYGTSFSESTFWVVLLYGIVYNLQNFGIDQNYIQRYLAARSLGDAKRSVVMGTLAYIPVSAVFFFIGTSLFAYYTVLPDALPSSLRDPAMADRVFPHFIVNELPAGATGLLIASILAAAMSTVDTSLNSASTIVLTDIYKRYFRPNAGERESMRVLHIGTLTWGLIGTSVALAMIDVKSALDAWWRLSGIFSGGMLGIFLLGLFSRRAGNVPAAVGAALGIAVIVWMTFSPNLPADGFFPRSAFHSFMIPVVGTLVIFLAGLVLSSVKAGKERTPENHF